MNLVLTNFWCTKNKSLGDFPGGPMVKPSPSNTGCADSIPGWGAKIPHASRPKNQNIKQKQYCNKFIKGFKKKKKAITGTLQEFLVYPWHSTRRDSLSSLSYIYTCMHRIDFWVFVVVKAICYFSLQALKGLKDTHSYCIPVQYIKIKYNFNINCTLEITPIIKYTIVIIPYSYHQPYRSSFNLAKPTATISVG